MVRESKKNPYNKEFIKRASKWISSPEGQQALEESQKRAAERSKAFKESCRVDPDVLRKVIGPVGR